MLRQLTATPPPPPVLAPPAYRTCAVLGQLTATLGSLLIIIPVKEKGWMEVPGNGYIIYRWGHTTVKGHTTVRRAMQVGNFHTHAHTTHIPCPPTYMHIHTHSPPPPTHTHTLTRTHTESHSQQVMPDSRAHTQHDSCTHTHSMTHARLTLWAGGLARHAGHAGAHLVQVHGTGLTPRKGEGGGGGRVIGFRLQGTAASQV